MKPLHLRRLTALIGLALAGGEAHAATWTVTSTGEPASITSASCAGVCTLRDAINAAANGDTIQFAPALDGATIALSLYSNPATGNQFGASAFYLDTKGVIIDATLNGLTQGVVISAQAANAGCWDNCFRLFDIDYFGGLTLNGITRAAGNGGTVNFTLTGPAVTTTTINTSFSTIKDKSINNNIVYCINFKPAVIERPV